MDFTAKARTSYFPVTDERAFRQLVENINADSKVHLYEDSRNGQQIFAFGCAGWLNGLNVEDDKELACEDMNITDIWAALQKLLPNGEAVIATIIGAEGMRCLTATATIITKDNISYIDLEQQAVKMAKDMLGD